MSRLESARASTKQAPVVFVVSMVLFFPADALAQPEKTQDKENDDDCADDVDDAVHELAFCVG